MSQKYKFCTVLDEKRGFFMNIEIRTDKNIRNSDRLITYVRDELNQEFQRHSERITQFSVHISDENGDKGGDDAGLKPVVVKHRAKNIDLSLHGAIDRVKRSLEHVLEKTENPRGGKLELADADEA